MVASSAFIVNTLYLVASSRSCHPGTLVLTRSNVSWEQSLMSWNCPLIVKYTPSSMFLYSNLPMVLHSLPAPLPLSTDGELLLAPDHIIQHRWIDPNELQLLVAWHYRPNEDATWEDYDCLRAQFPNFHLEDKTSFEGGRRDKILITYRRHKARNE
ncbi:hypothetical protein LINPERHAP1_LOCUS31419 [Linum perenne]